MKKLIFAAIAAVLFISCAKERITTISKGDVANIEFSVGLSAIGSRALGSGTNVDVLHYNIFNAGGDKIQNLCGSTELNSDGKFYFTLELIENAEYDIVFWAQCSNCNAYTLDGCNVTVDYTKTSANSDIADAFYGGKAAFCPSTDAPSFTLMRPFAQLNAATTDYNALTDLGYTSMTSTIAIKAHNTFNILTGDVTGEKVDVAFTATAIPTDNFHISGYKYLSMNYLLAPKAIPTLANTAFTFVASKDDGSTTTIPNTTYANIPLQQNYRTNILGALLTQSTDFTIDFENEFNPNENIENIVAPNQVWYTTADGNPLPLDQMQIFDANMVSNTYDNDSGFWIATFDTPITEVYGTEDPEVLTNSAALRANITSITLPNSITKIGSCAFALTSISEITIPESVTEIGYGIVAGCPCLSAIYGEFSSEDNRCLIYNGTLNSPALAGLTEYTLPDEVTAVGAISFALCSTITSLTIPDSVQYIEPLAFYMTLSIKNITIGTGVTFLLGNTFAGCEYLESITLNGTLQSCGSTYEENGYIRHDNAIIACPNLCALYGPSAASDNRSIVINGEMYEFIYGNLTEESEYTIPAGITTITRNTFKNSNLGKLTIANDVETVCESALWGCGIKELVIGDSVKSLERACFDECYNLKKITIGTGIESIDEWAFSECNHLEEIHISSLKDWCEIEFSNEGANPLYKNEYTTSTDRSLYLNGTKIEGTLVIPDGTTSIGSYAFLNLNSITEVSIPQTVTSCGKAAFQSCDNLEKFIGPLASTDGSYFVINNKLAAVATNSPITNLTISDSITSIGSYAAAGCKNITSVVLPASVTVIEEGAFSGSESLESVTFAEGLQTIGSEAFSSCEQLSEVVIPDSVITIDRRAFYSCDDLIKITIGSGVQAIGDRAFADCAWIPNGDGSKHGTDIHIYCRPTTPPTVEGSELIGTNSKRVHIYVPASDDDSIINAYKAAAGWSNYTTYNNYNEYSL